MFLVAFKENGLIKITGKIGFISYKSTSKYPSVYFTKDRGKTWNKLEMPINLSFVVSTIALL